MSDKEIKINLQELEYAINMMNGLKNRTHEISIVRKSYEDFLMKNTGESKKKMQSCEYKAGAIRNNLVMLIKETSKFLSKTKMSVENDEFHIINKIDNLTK